ncbi:DUF4430 domain-containing protein [Clostridium aminobutyricum]|uniref:DUF4430 domain-containing protein n=1 Tax=Clostridium aminobutyricum TaxID=33953 RepID=A0A939DBH6_CLOAM|nr:DUF4430 domain-containing protein [Clostridium aminobutyricum]MBN7774213.1 DUF4430 domain-containing protein [Clostridium aminobutyricum]
MKKRIRILIPLIVVALLVASYAIFQHEDSEDAGKLTTTKVITSDTAVTQSAAGLKETESSQSALQIVQNGSTTASATQLDDKTGKAKALDKYLTESTPEGKPTPVEPQQVQVDKKQIYTCTLSIVCGTILNNMDKLDPEKVELVPKDGVIFSAAKVQFYEGESVFDVLQRATKDSRIHMEYVNTPIYNSAYIEGINNLYEFDCGELSGWMYKVNGWFPNYGCSRYQLKDGDVVEWIYTCDLGKDIGGDYSVGGE